MATLTGKVGISAFLGGIAASGGMSMSNVYEVNFKFDGSNQRKLIDELRKVGFASFDAGTAWQNLIMLCEEASLPGMMANTGQTVGVNMGEGQVNYAHTKSFTDITLGWTCDANLLPLKFLNTWMREIFPDDTNFNGGGRNSINRVVYPKEYLCPVVTITKGERDKDDVLGRTSGIYTLHDAWPYSIQSTPLSYGASTLLKVTASFYYRKWTFESINIKGTTTT